MRVRPIILLSQAWPAVHYFPLCLIHRMILEKRYWICNVCFEFLLQMLSETFIVLKRTERHVVKNIYGSSCKVPVILRRYYQNFNILYTFPRNIVTSNFMKSPPVEADLFLADGQTWQTDMTSLIGACRNFANGPKNGRWIQRVLLNYMVLQKKDKNLNNLISKNLKTSWNKIFCVCLLLFWEDSAALRAPSISR